eukprot:PhF_6_TR25843/c0_g1_i1/m.36512/K13622/btaA; S-adenosylmethionine-diacylglycerol 3-amino-3-carboxypropyl transferase
MDGLIFANMNEDYAAEVHLIEQNPKSNQRILCIASSGDTALSLLSLAKTEHVVAIDVNPAAIELCEFKQHVLPLLSQEDMLVLMGHAEDHSQRAKDVPKRLQLLEKVQSTLAPEVARKWNARAKTAITYGLMHCGARERFLTRVRRAVESGGRKYDFSDASVLRILEEQFALVNVMGDHPLLESQRNEYSANDIVESLRRCACSDDNNKNYFASLYMRGLYPPLVYPAYLSPSGQNLAFSHGGYGTNRLSFRHHSLESALEDHTEGKFDLISLSNLCDWMSDTEFMSVLHKAKDKLVSPGTILIRSQFGHLFQRLERMGIEMDCVDRGISNYENSIYFGKHSVHVNSGVIAA